MSIQLIQQYHAQVEKIICYGGSRKESSVRKPSDPTIREKFNIYRSVDYKEDLVDLIGRVTAVCVETVKIIAEMPSS